MNKDLEADVYAKKAEFYMLCPNFLDINYSTRFSDVLDSLFLISSSQKINFNTEIFLTDCGADAPETAAFLLSCRIFSGSDAEFELTQYLSEQGNKGIWYLMKLVEASEDPVFIDNAVKSITKKNIPGIFDFLDGLIKKDIVNYGHSVISAFRTMEDFRIEATLMREIKNTKPSKSFRKEPSPAFQMVLLNESIHNIRIEATLALSDFNTPSSVEFLKTGLEDEQIAPYCGAALYKLTGDEKYLNSIEKSIKEDEKDVVLADFLRRFNNLKAQKLAKKLTLF
jgi:hypothetical protein